MQHCKTWHRPQFVRPYSTLALVVFALRESHFDVGGDCIKSNLMSFYLQHRNGQHLAQRKGQIEPDHVAV